MGSYCLFGIYMYFCCCNYNIAAKVVESSARAKLSAEKLQFLLLEFLHEVADAVQLIGYLDVLRTMLHALAATDAVVGLPELGHSTVVAHQEGAASLPIVGVLAAFGHIALVDALVVVEQDGRNINAVGAGHAILAVVAGNRGVLLDQLGRVEEELPLLVR